jgi:hypothetical protein
MIKGQLQPLLLGVERRQAGTRTARVQALIDGPLVVEALAGGRCTFREALHVFAHG